MGITSYAQKTFEGRLCFGRGGFKHVEKGFLCLIIGAPKGPALLILGKPCIL